jgi:hypothetical protein
MLALPLLQLLDATPEGYHGAVELAILQRRDLPQTLLLPLLLGLLPAIQTLSIPLLHNGRLGQPLCLRHGGLLQRLSLFGLLLHPLHNLFTFDLIRDHLLVQLLLAQLCCPALRGARR